MKVNRQRLLDFLSSRRMVVQASIDAAAWTIAIAIATLLRYDLQSARVHWFGVAAMVPLAVEAQVVSGYFFGLYRGRWRFGSFDEAAELAKSAAVTTAALFLLDRVLVTSRSVPLSSALASGPIALVIMFSARYAWRWRIDSRRRPTGDGTSRLLVFGAGEGGAQVVTAMLRDPDSPYLPVGLLDDDPTKRNLRILGVAVLGGRNHLARAAAATQADALLIAIPSAAAPLVNELTHLADEADLPVKILPPVRDLFGTDVALADIRDVDVADLLGRHKVDTDVDAIAGYLTGRRVLVTGAGGSIGSELCRQIVNYGPAELIMLDRNESALHEVQLSIDGRGLLDSGNVVLGNIRDPEFLAWLFAERRPEVVFHAAAFKHLPILERAPGEATKNNVLGTLAVLDAAATAGVERFVNISTDKAADPISVLGYTKRIAERLTAHFAEHDSGTFLSVRFGNVLGSSGSVLTTFRSQLDSGGPLTVTDPDVTRYFMTVHEAVELVIQAGAIGQPGEALVLDMGEPVRIADVAERLARQSTRPTRVVFTGLRPGEKLHEVLLGEGEEDRRPCHPLISHVAVPPLDPRQLEALDPTAPAGTVIAALAALSRAETSALRD